MLRLLFLSILFICFYSNSYSQLVPFSKTFKIIEQYKWGADNVGFVTTPIEFTGERIISISHDLKSVALKFILPKDTAVINTEIVNTIEEEKEEGIMTVLFLIDKENYQYILEYCGDDYAFYFNYDEPSKGYNGFLKAEKWEEVKIAK